MLWTKVKDCPIWLAQLVLSQPLDSLESVVLTILASLHAMRRAYLQNVTYGVSIYVDAFRISKQFRFWSHLPWPSLASSSLSKSYLGSAWQRSYALEDGRSMAPQRPLNRAHFQAFVNANQAPPTFLLHFCQCVPLSKFYATLFRFSTCSVLSSVTQATFP